MRNLKALTTLFKLGAIVLLITGPLIIIGENTRDVYLIRKQFSEVIYYHECSISTAAFLICYTLALLLLFINWRYQFLLVSAYSLLFVFAWYAFFF